MLFKSKNWGSFSYSFWYLTIYVYYKIIYIYDVFIIHNIFLFGYLTKKVVSFLGLTTFHDLNNSNSLHNDYVALHKTFFSIDR